MIYLASSRIAAAVPLLDEGVIGIVNTPNTRYQLDPRWTWLADNGAFAASRYVGDEKWLRWLGKWGEELRASCIMATLPDVVGDHRATLARSWPHISAVRDLGYPVGYVAQDGMTVPDLEQLAGHIDGLFIGGTTEFKLGVQARDLIAHAHTHGLHVHAGRVNSYKRLQYFHDLGAHSADGTFLSIAPAVNIPRMLRWFDKLGEPRLF